MTLFASAYRQLAPAEKAYVDGYVQRVEAEQVRKGERIALALTAPVEPAVIEASRGMLDRALVRAAIAERINTLAADQDLSPHRVIKEYMGIAFGSVGDYMTIGEDGMPYFDLARCTPEQLAAVQSVEYEETFTRNGPNRKFKFKLHDKLSALGQLAKYMGIQETDNPIWRAENAKTVTPALPESVTENDAANAYARAIGS